MWRYVSPVLWRSRATRPTDASVRSSGSLVPGLAPHLALDSSRGSEDPLLILFLRSSVLALDVLLYMPPVLFFLSRRLHGRGRRTRTIAILSVLLQPSLVLIDHGHFQYNSIMLGLCAGCFALLYSSLPNADAGVASTGPAAAGAQGDKRKELKTDLSRQVSYQYIAAAVLFSLALCFKQMALYFAPAVFAVMLGRCWGLAGVGFERG